MGKVCEFCGNPRYENEILDRKMHEGCDIVLSIRAEGESDEED